MVLIPSVLAYAELAGSGPVNGIFAAIAGTVAYFVFASSRHMNVGPDGAVALLAGTIVLPLTGGDPSKALLTGAWLALFTGVILIVAAKLRLGIVASFLSKPVLLGYLNGAAVVIIVSQWGKLFGIDLEQELLIQRVIEWVGKVPETHLETLGTGACVLVLLFVCKYSFPRIPPLIPVFFVALACGVFIDFGAMGLAVIGEVGAVAPQAVGFTLSLDDAAKLAIGALGLSMLIFPEGVLLGRAMAERHEYAIKPDQELVALGSANIASGIFQGFTIGGSQTRTLLNSAVGGRTQIANLASALFLVIFLVFVAQWLVDLPKVAIAAILIFTGFGLIEVSTIRELFSADRQSAWIALATMATVVFVGVLPGILIGTSFSIAILLAKVAKPQDALLGRVPGSLDLHDLGDDDRAETIPGLVAYRFYGPVIFANIDYFIDRLQQFIEDEDEPVQQVLIDAGAIPFIDYTAMEKLLPQLRKLKEQNIEVTIAEAHLPLLESTMTARFEGLLNRADFFDGVRDAVAAFSARGEAPASRD